MKHATSLIPPSAWPALSSIFKFDHHTFHYIRGPEKYNHTITRCVLARHFGPIDYYGDVLNLILLERNFFCRLCTIIWLLTIKHAPPHIKPRVWTYNTTEDQKMPWEFFFSTIFLYLKALSIDACPRTITAKSVPIPGQNHRGSANTDPWHTAAGQ